MAVPVAVQVKWRTNLPIAQTSFLGTVLKILVRPHGKFQQYSSRHVQRVIIFLLSIPIDSRPLAAEDLYLLPVFCLQQQSRDGLFPSRCRDANNLSTMRALRLTCHEVDRKAHTSRWADSLQMASRNLCPCSFVLAETQPG